MEPEQVVGMILGARQEGDAWRQAELLATAIQGLNLKIMEGLRSIPGMGTRVAGPRGTNVEIWEDSCTAIQYKAWLDGNVNGVYLSGHEVISSHVLRWGRFGNFSEHFNEVMSVSYDEAAAIKRGKSCRKVFCNGFAIGGYVTMLLGIIGGIVAGVAMDSDDDMRDFAVGMLLGMVAGLGLMISLMSICINFSCMCLEPENESECLPPRIYYDVQSQIPPIIRSILGRLVGAIPRDMVQQMEAGQRGGGHEEQSVRVAGRFLVECFAKPAHALLAQLLNYLQNPASAASVSIEHFEAIFTLFKLTKQSFVGMNFGADLSFALADAMVNLIVNGSMPLHTMLMNFARLTPTNFNDFPQNDEERYGGFNLYSSERHAVLDKLQGIFMTVQPQIHTMLPEMQAKMNHIKLAIELKMRADQRR
jgi:hypothetical protein